MNNWVVLTKYAGLQCLERGLLPKTRISLTISKCYNGFMVNRNKMHSKFRFGYELAPSARLLRLQSTYLVNLITSHSHVHVLSVQKVVTPFYIVSYYIKSVTTSWTHSTLYLCLISSVQEARMFSLMPQATQVTLTNKQYHNSAKRS